MNSYIFGSTFLDISNIPSSLGSLGSLSTVLAYMLVTFFFTLEILNQNILAVEGKGNFFLKMTGEKATVTAAADAFRASFGGKEADEKPFVAE